MNYCYFLHRPDYLRYIARQQKIGNIYPANIQPEIGKVLIGQSPAILVRKYIWGRECKPLIITATAFL